MSFAIDLVCLAADTNIKETLAALLNRPQALAIRPVQYQLAVHPEHDPGCARHGADFLRPFQSRARHALIIFDRAGSGRENLDRDNLEAELEERLRSAGWTDRAAAIAIDPEKTEEQSMKWTQRTNDEIPTSSMADIAFLLIIYFMVTATFTATRGLDLEMPAEQENDPSPPRRESWWRFSAGRSGSRLKTHAA